MLFNINGAERLFFSLVKIRRERNASLKSIDDTVLIPLYLLFNKVVSETVSQYRIKRKSGIKNDTIKQHNRKNGIRNDTILINYNKKRYQK